MPGTATYRDGLGLYLSTRKRLVLQKPGILRQIAACFDEARERAELRWDTIPAEEREEMQRLAYAILREEDVYRDQPIRSRVLGVFASVLFFAYTVLAGRKKIRADLDAVQQAAFRFTDSVLAAAEREHPAHRADLERVIGRAEREQPALLSR